MIAIIGKNSKIGKYLLKSIGVDLNIGTTRDVNDKYFFDLNNPNFNLFENLPIKSVILCAGISNIKYCQQNPYLSNLINVTNTIKTIEYFNKRNIPLTYLSSNSVFGDYFSPPDEQFSYYAPKTLYASQKVQVEKFILNSSQRNNIIRLTKVIDADSIFHLFFRDNKLVEFYDNFYLSPISLDYAARSILVILNNASNGIYHLSGEADFSYHEFACLIANTVSYLKLIPKAKNESFDSFHSCSLTMNSTRKIPSLQYQRTSDVINYLIRTL